MACLCLSDHFRTLLPFTCAGDSCFLHVGATHGCEFCDRFVGASRESLPAARLLLNAVHRLLLNVSDASLFLTRASRTSGITFSAAVHDCSSFVRPAHVKYGLKLICTSSGFGSFCVSSWIMGTCLRMLLGSLATSSMTCT